MPELSATITNFEPSTVLVNRTASGGANLAVESTDSARARVTDFRVPPIQFRLEPFVFSDDEMYLVVFLIKILNVSVSDQQLALLYRQ